MRKRKGFSGVPKQAELNEQTGLNAQGNSDVTEATSSANTFAATLN